MCRPCLKESDLVEHQLSRSIGPILAMRRLPMKSYKLIVRRVRTALALPWRDKWVVLQAWTLLLVADLGLRVLPFHWVRKLFALGRKNPQRILPGGGSGTVQHFRSLVNIAGRNHLYPMRCLQHSLVLQWLLGRRGIVTALQIGVRKEPDGLYAHAWLEHAGRPIGESERILARFAPLASHKDDA
jgi:hypothetical protein